MFVVMLTYVKPLTEVDAAMEDHVAFLETHFKAGTFLAAGRQNPRVGGVILARKTTAEKLHALMQQDPFVTRGIATFTVTEFRTSLHHSSFKALADPGTRTVG